jgi:hypothetical protein
MYIVIARQRVGKHTPAEGKRAKIGRPVLRNGSVNTIEHHRVSLCQELGPVPEMAVQGD